MRGRGRIASVPVLQLEEGEVGEGRARLGGKRAAGGSFLFQVWVTEKSGY
uniref:CKI1 n=1 Tax=Arundo donax TaxID=35708 RepID=A0A0A9EF84_ARUDO